VLVIPAIDLKDGEAVRLYKGDYNQKTVYSKEPSKLAKQFQDMGAEYLHIVDLDGAKDGKCTNYSAIKAIRESISIPIEVGGGIRDRTTVKVYLEDLKIDRVILGTVALNNPKFLKEMLQIYGPEKIVVGVDVKDGFVSVSGWLETSEIEYIEFIKSIEQIGIRYIVATDISKDGTLQGPNFEMYKCIKENSNINFVVSGGIKDKQNILDINELDYYACIVGKAYYEGKVNIGGNQMSEKKIIPCLDTKDGKLVKGINFVDLVDIGDPIEYAKMYEEQGADEIVFLDITATNEERDTRKELIEKSASAINVPIAIGGGIRTIEDMRNILGCGASKVSINSAAVLNPDIIKQAAGEFGSQCIVIAIDSSRDEAGNFKVFIKGGKENTGIDLIEWAKKCEDLGAGEILLTSKDADGMKTGYDIEMTKVVVDNVSIPVTASGGCGSIQDIVDVFKKTNCSSALAASLFHYKEATVEEVKAELEKNAISVRR